MRRQDVLGWGAGKVYMAPRRALPFLLLAAACVACGDRPTATDLRGDPDPGSDPALDTALDLLAEPDAAGGDAVDDPGTPDAGAVVLVGGGWTWAHPRPQGLAINALSGFGPDSVLAAGGSLLRWDGLAWSGVDAPFRVEALSGAGPTDVWAVGEQGRAARWDGSTWTVFETGATHTLFAAWAASSTEVWVAGSAGDVARWDGQGWHASVLDLKGGGIITGPPEVYGLWGEGPGLPWAVGQFALEGGQGVVARLVAGEWTTAFLGDPGERLSAIWGTSGEDVWVVGCRDDGKPAILHFDGQSWSRPATDVPECLECLFGWTGGQAVAAGPLGTIARLKDGVWTAGRLPGDEFLTAAFGAGPADLWLASLWGTLLHFDGVGWAAHSAGTSERATLEAAWASAPGAAWAVGRDGAILRFDGIAWAPEASPASDHLYDVFGTAPDAMIAVGSNTVLRRDEGGWSLDGAGQGRLLAAVHGNSSGTVLAVGGGVRAGGAWGAVAIRLDGATWVKEEVPANVDLADVRVEQDGSAWAVDTLGRLFRRDAAGAWSEASTAVPPVPVPAGPVVALGGPGGAGGGRADAGGETFASLSGGHVARWDGTAWVELPGTLPAPASDLWGLDTTDMWAVGDDFAAHWDGVRWTVAVLGTGRSLRGVAGSPGGPVFAVGDEGTVLRGP